MNQIQTQKEAYYKKVGVAPGVPTEKGKQFQNVQTLRKDELYKII